MTIDPTSLVQAQPLAGVKVLELGQNIAGPYAGAILAALGADVVKIERPEGGDDARGWGPPFYQGTSSTFHAMNRDKRSVALDLKDIASITWLKDYLRECDVLVQNLRPGVMEDLGLTPEALHAINPRLVYVSLWAFGAEGPMKLKPGYEPMIQAFSGIFAMNATDTSPPARVGMQILDMGTGVWAALGCIAGLFQRHTTGRGCVVDASLLETALNWIGLLLTSYFHTGKPPERHRTGSARLVVFQAFDTADREIVVAAANDRLFAKLAREVGHPEWAKDPRFATNAGRAEHKAEIVDEVARIMRQRPAAEWIARLEAAGVPCAPINDLDQITAEPQFEALGIKQTMPENDVAIIGLPLSFDRKRPPVRRRAPKNGEHNVELTGKPAPQGTRAFGSDSE